MDLPKHTVERLPEEPAQPVVGKLVYEDIPEFCTRSDIARNKEKTTLVDYALRVLGGIKRKFLNALNDR